VSESRFGRAFPKLAWANLCAHCADQLALAAAPLLAVIVFGAGVGITGLLQTAQLLPYLAFAIPLGVVADRMRKARLMAAAELLRTVALVLIVLLVATQALTLTLLGILGFLAASATVAYSVAAPALVPSLVQKDRLTAANARLELGRTVAFTAGPAAAGIAIDAFGGSTAFAFAAALSFVAAMLVTSISEPDPMPHTRRSVLRDIQAGASFVARHKLLRPVFLTQFVFGIAFALLYAAYIPFAVERLGLSPAGVGGTLATYGIGMVAGALCADWISRNVSFGVVISIGPLCGFIASLVMVLTIWFPSGGLAATGFFILGAGPILWIIGTATLRQTVTPAELLARVSAVHLLAYGSRPMGAALAAIVGAVYGAEACIYAASAGFLLQAAIMLSSPVVRLTTLVEEKAV
jgi:predicted MFS family arabinose efflux permease